MSLTPEQLLAPRWEVRADYPKSPFVVGLIIATTNKRTPLLPSLKEWRDGGIEEEIWHTDFIDTGHGSTMYSERYFAPFPEIFKPLQWWEEREASDILAITYVKHMQGWMAPVAQHFPNDNPYSCLIVGKNEQGEPTQYEWDYRWLLPATESEYLEYQKQKP